MRSFERSAKRNQGGTRSLSLPELKPSPSLARASTVPTSSKERGHIRRRGRGAKMTRVVGLVPAGPAARLWSSAGQSRSGTPQGRRPHQRFETLKTDPQVLHSRVVSTSVLGLGLQPCDELSAAAGGQRHNMPRSSEPLERSSHRLSVRRRAGGEIHSAAVDGFNVVPCPAIPQCYTIL